LRRVGRVEHERVVLDRSAAGLDLPALVPPARPWREGHVEHRNERFPHFRQVLAKQNTVRVHVAIGDGDGFAGHPDEALDVRFAELRRPRVRAAEHDHLPPPRAAQVVDVLIDEQPVAAQLVGRGE
jgi:hypothetical protein